MRISGRVVIDAEKAVLKADTGKFILVPYPRLTKLPDQQKEGMGAILFSYLHGCEARIEGDRNDDHLYNARVVVDAPKKVRDVTISPEKKTRFSADIEQHFKQDGAQIATRLNFAGIFTISAFYHRLKGMAGEVPAMSRYLGVPETSIQHFIKGMEEDQKNSALVAAPLRIPVAHGVNVKRLLSERGVRATRKSRSTPPTFPEADKTPNLPSAVDHRKSVTGVRSQGYRGTCVAHTAAAMLEHELVRTKSANRRLDLSEQYLYWACKQKDGAENEEGTFIEYAVEVLKSGVLLGQAPGTCKEAEWKYNQVPIEGNEGQGPPPSRAQNAQRFKIRGYKKVQHNSIAELKSALAEGHCVGLSVFTYHFWNDGYTSREGIISLPVGIPPDGAHAICLVGYEDADDNHTDGYFLFKNSWSPLWGATRKKDPGFGSLPYRYVINEAIEAWFIEL